MFCAFVGAGLGNFFRCKLTKHHFTLFLGIVSSVSLACFAYAGLLKLGEILFGISIQHEAGYICAMLFIIPGFPFITSGIDLAKLDMRSGMERLTYALIIVLASAEKYSIRAFRAGRAANRSRTCGRPGSPSCAFRNPRLPHVRPRRTPDGLRYDTPPEKIRSTSGHHRPSDSRFRFC